MRLPPALVAAPIGGSGYYAFMEDGRLVLGPDIAAFGVRCVQP